MEMPRPILHKNPKPTIRLDNGRQWQGFNAGISAVYIVVIAIAIIGTHGSVGDDKPVSWTDIAVVMVMLFLFADSVVELYKFWKRQSR